MTRKVHKIFWLTLGVALLVAGLAWAADPNIPAVVSPPDDPGGTNLVMDPEPLLKWTGGDPDPGDIVTYTVNIAGASESWVKSLKKLQWRIPTGQPLPANSTYQWHIVARDNHGHQVTSPTWTFKTGAYPWINAFLPAMARPTYVVEIQGERFGDTPGTVLLANKAVGSENWGRVLSWSDSAIRILMPCYQCYGTLLPGWLTMRVITADDLRSNAPKFHVGYGGGGTTY